MIRYDQRHDITRNAAKCLICEDIIESTHVHNLVTCKCGNVSVDGGLDYCKRLYKDFKTIQDLTEYKEVPKVVTKKKKQID